jgi:hypothetical protein
MHNPKANGFAVVQRQRDMLPVRLAKTPCSHEEEEP